MTKSWILIVDDEPNIRLTLTEALAPLGCGVASAASGEEALQAVERQPIALVLLDLRMPGLDGMAVLRRLAEEHPDVRVAILTAHGTIENAVEAMKLGAVDFIQKPFSLEQGRGMVQAILDREQIEETRASDYGSRMELARRAMARRDSAAARAHVQRAIAMDSGRPEAFNLLGVLEEIAGHRSEAQKQYRIALDLDPAYRPASENLERSVQAPHARGPMQL